MHRVICVANTLRVEGSMLAVQPGCGNYAGCMTSFRNLELRCKLCRSLCFPQPAEELIGGNQRGEARLEQKKGHYGK